MECSLILLRFLDIFIHYYRSFMSEFLYLKQTFFDCLSYQYIRTCQMWLPARENLLNLLLFCEFCTNLANILIWSTISSQNIHKLCIWYEYRHLVTIKCQMWMQVMEHSLILLHFLGIFIPFCRPFMSELLYLHQTFSDYVSNQ